MRRMWVSAAIRVIAAGLLFAPLAASADPPPAITPTCAQFGTETGYLCSFTRRIDLTWVCLEYGFTSLACADAYTDCEVELVWWENEPLDEVESWVTCSTPVWDE